MRGTTGSVNRARADEAETTRSVVNSNVERPECHVTRARAMANVSAVYAIGRKSTNLLSL